MSAAVPDSHPADPPTVPPVAPADPATQNFVPPTSQEADQAAAPPGFVVEAELGRGGMGVVYKARQTALDRTVALKVVLHAGLASGEALARFRIEALAVARLQHPHIVQVHEVGEFQGLPYAALEYVDGGTLADRLRRGPAFAPAEAAALVATVADAVQVAHERHVVHRDLKPGNLLLTKDGVPKVADFGLAKRLDGGDGLTVTGAMCGTPAYMAPEQAAGGARDVGPAADGYALGVILYELLTGRVPFRAPDLAGLLDRVRTAEPEPVRRRRPGVPADLETVCLKCLQKDPARRYLSAAELAADLRRFLAGEPVQARPVGVVERAVKWVRRNRAATAVGGALVVGAVLALWQAGRAEEAAGRAWTAEQTAQGRATALAAEKARAEKQLTRAEGLLHAGRLADFERFFAERRLAAAWDRLTDCNWALRGWEYDRLWTQYHRQGLVLRGHADTVTVVAFSPDGTRIAAGCLLALTAGTEPVRLWDATTGRLVAELQGHQRLLALAFSPDGTRLVTAGGPARIWDARTGTHLADLKGHTAGVMAVAYSPDGARLATTSPDQTARLWDAATGQALAECRGHTAQVEVVAFSPDGQRLATGSQDETVRLWDAPTGRPLAELKGHPGGVYKLAWGPDGTRLAAVALWGPTARLWDARTGQLVADLKGHSTGATAVAFSPAGADLATAAVNGAVRRWDARTGALRGEWPGHTATVMALAYSADGRRLATAGADAAVRLWDAPTGQALADLKGHTAALYSLAFSGDGRRLATCGMDHTVRVWDTAPEVTPPSIAAYPGGLGRMAVSPDGRRLAVACRAPLVRVFDAATGQALADLQDHPKRHWVRAVAYRPDGAQLATACTDPFVRLFDARSGRLLGRLPEAAGGAAETAPDGDNLPPVLSADQVGVLAVAFSPDGTHLAAGATDHRVRVWDLRTRQLQFDLPGHTESVDAVIYSPDGTHLATTGPDGTVRLWDAATGRHRAEWKAPPGGIGALAFSPDSALLATGSSAYPPRATHTAWLWEVRTGQPRAELKGHTGAVEAVAFSPDGRRLATGGPDGTVRLWDTRTGQALAEIHGHLGGVGGLGFSPDGILLAAAGGNGTVRLWDASLRPGAQLLKGPAAPVTAVAFSPDAVRLLARDEGGAIYAWDRTTGYPLDETEPLPATATAEATTPDGKYRLFVLGGQAYYAETARWQEHLREEAARWAEQSRPRPDWHRDQAAKAAAAGQWFAAAFHHRQLARLLADQGDAAAAVDHTRRADACQARHAAAPAAPGPAAGPGS